ncbi:hypothetical protein BDN70DRAFT_922796 [Pholiota conissans]|uniref:F-box domain-containing protein n=1 Tax=Pholiota conissans TaxID=109636 RepID=A0A9P6CSC9_9AGAR|nr:hypothetical protein BDN70DRAFT_922796 [Pholiota conissans]
MSFAFIPLELFPLIASFIPLRSASQTLLSLALGNHYLYDIVRPLLYSRLILGDETITIKVIQKILDEPRLGMAVTEIYIMTALSMETREEKKPVDAIDGLQKLVDAKLLPRLVALGIHLLDGWEDPNPRSHLSIEFWRNLRAGCPQLNSLSLRNVGNYFDQWISGPVIDEIFDIPRLSVLRIEWVSDTPEESESLRALKQLPRLASSLHTLSLKSHLQDVDHIIHIDFPHLKWLRLDWFGTGNDVSSITDFFRRHPQLESLSLLDCQGEWFSNDIGEGFLPNLKHLQARFDDIRNLVPLLSQLTSLSFTQSYNCQVPYLLRSVLPNGLPNLKSLEIEQARWDDRDMEGIAWYETLDGKFHVEKRRKKIPRNFMDDYMHSILRGAPNLEELGLHGMTLVSEHLISIAPTMAQFANLKRFYCRGYAKKLRSGTDAPLHRHPFILKDFLDGAEALGRACNHMERVTSISAMYPPYISLLFIRNSEGEVVEVRRSDHYGMEISAQEDNPFPCNP